jgi:peptide deformylase
MLSLMWQMQVRDCVARVFQHEYDQLQVRDCVARVFQHEYDQLQVRR